jgi:NADH-quinone oxidoreductase subunit L
VFDIHPIDLALIALFLPLGAAIICAVFSLSPGTGKLAAFPVVIALAVSAFCSILALTQLGGLASDRIAYLSKPVIWFAVGNFSAEFTILLDPLSAVMLATVTFVATTIAVFSAAYMRGGHGTPDEGYARYFALISLFVFCMCLLVLANNFMLLFAGWEGVGVCSYLLVGYYYAKPSAASAARKAFLVTRLGDVGLILGIFLLYQSGGFNTNLTTLFEFILRNPSTHPTMTAACLLLFCGAVGKSAQLPLYVWLPDAMEGPTPVSALIHAATMVTAGVYLLARCAPLFVLSPLAQAVVCLIGGLTALLGAFIALTQNDLKRILAYSTISQLGFMFMALGTGGAIAANLAVTAAIFHLGTHAFFKALLFLGAGSVMHAMGGVIDVRRIGGLRRLMPITHLTFLIGAAALAGVPLLAGFWSKDAILDTLYEAASHGGVHRELYWFVLVVAIGTAGLTAFYSFRAYFLTFHGEVRIPSQADGHARESSWIMLVPLILLAIGAAIAGIVAEPFTHWLSGFLIKTPGLNQANKLMPPGSAHSALQFNFTIAAISSAVALAGIALAWRAYRDGHEGEVPLRLRGIYNASRNKLYVDELYAAFFVKPAESVASMGKFFDRFIETLTRLVGYLPRLVGGALRPIQNGLIQYYALGMILGLAVLLTVIVARSTR